MPATRVVNNVQLDRCAVVGEYADGGEAIVRHVGVLATPLEVVPTSSVPVYDSSPPLHVGQIVEGESQIGTMRPDAVGWVGDLTASERDGIAIWIASMQPLVSANLLDNYVLLPAVEEVMDSVSHQRISVKFSCAGFVSACYSRGAGIVLVDEDQLPEVGRDVLRRAWPVEGRVATRLGIEGAGPWRLLLPGYFLNSLARPDPRAPFVAVSTHASFPPA